jgi:ABC-2 type transport system permease protein
MIAAKTGAVALNASQMLWYIALNEWVLVSIPSVHDDIEEDLHSGRLAYQLPRPISYIGSMFAESLGALTANLTVLGVVTVIFVYFQVGALPFDFPALALSIGFGFISGILGIIYLMLIGLSSFWLQDVSPFYWIWEKLLFMFGGLILPLTIYPKWMQTFAHYTPFPAILGQRSALALDFSVMHVIDLVSSLMLWIVLGLCCLFILYRKSLTILTIEGG